jgi:hypothetical protein
LSTAQFNDHFAFATGVLAGEAPAKSTCPDHLWPVPFVTDGVLHRLEIASPERYTNHTPNSG